MTRFLAAACLACLVGVAHAQLRTLPTEAKRAQIRHVHDNIVLLDGKQARLSRGARVRDANNRIVVPMSIPAGSLVRYTVDAQGEVSAVWILTAHEAAQSPAPAK